MEFRITVHIFLIFLLELDIFSLERFLNIRQYVYQLNDLFFKSSNRFLERIAWSYQKE